MCTALTGDFRAGMDSVPRQNFLDGTAGEETRIAAERLPGYLIARSPLYQVEIKGTSPLASVLTIPMPNESEPYETVDLYEWTGGDWRFVPSQVLVAQEGDALLSELNYVPQSFMVMQTSGLPPTAGAILPVGETLPDAGRDALTEVVPYGYQLAGDGSIQGDVAISANAGGSYGVVPSLRNWGDDGVVRTDLLDNLLISKELQETHVNAIEALVVGNNLPGIEIDYRGLDPTMSQDFTDFATAVADRLHAALTAPSLGGSVANVDTWNSENLRLRLSASHFAMKP